MWFSTQVACLLIFSLPASLAADECSISPSMRGIPAQNLAYALQNITCPVNTAYTNPSNSSSVLPSSDDIISTIKDTTAYLNSSGNITSSAQTDLWRGPINDVPFEFSQYLMQLLDHKDDLSKVASSLSDGLTKQHDAAKVFFDLVVLKMDADQKSEVNGILLPVLGDLKCGAEAFKSGSKVTACPETSSAPVATGSEVSVSRKGTSTAAATASATDQDSGVMATGYPEVRVLAGAMMGGVAMVLL